MVTSFIQSTVGTEYDVIECVGRYLGTQTVIQFMQCQGRQVLDAKKIAVIH